MLGYSSCHIITVESMFTAYHTDSHKVKRCAGDEEKAGRPSRPVKRRLYADGEGLGPKCASLPKCKKNNDGDEPPSKKVCKKMHHDGEACGDCSVWLTLGGDPEFKSKHLTNKYVHHPQDRAKTFSEYLSINSQQFSLRPDSCMCNCCYIDCDRNARGKDQKNSKQPRWIDIHKNKCKAQECCPVCFFYLLQYTPGNRTPSKFKTAKWGPTNWQQNYDWTFWIKYFKISKPGFNIRLTENSRLCHRHYMETYNKINNKSCKSCKAKSDLKILFEDDLNKVKQQDTFNLLDWICDKCFEMNRSAAAPVVTVESETRTSIEKAVDEAMKTIHENGIILRRDLVTKFVHSFKPQPLISKNDAKKSFENMLTSRVNRTENISKFSRDEYVFVLGTIYYDKNQVREDIVKQMYDYMYTIQLQEKEIQQYRENSIKLSDLKTMLDKQTDLFNAAEKNVDYKSFFTDEKENDAYLFKDYLYEPLVDLILKITRCGKYSNERPYGGKSDKENHKDTFKLQMALPIHVYCAT